MRVFKRTYHDGRTSKEYHYSFWFRGRYIRRRGTPNKEKTRDLGHQHRARLQELDATTKSELLDVAGICMEVIEEALGAQGFNIGFNTGRAAGAGIIDHIHLHVVPRWIGDTNFMPVLGDTKVLSEDLEGTYERLRPIFDRKTAAE